MVATRTSSQFRPVEPALVEQRRHQRVAVEIASATVRAHGSPAATASLLDLAIYGCRLSTAEPHPIGERVWLRLGGSMPIAATVVWAEDGATGCRFDAPIEPALMRALTLSRQ